VTVDNLSRGTAKHGNREPKLPDRRAHAINCGIVLAGIAGVFVKPVDWLIDDLHSGHSGYGRRLDSVNGIDLRVIHDIHQPLDSRAVFAEWQRLQELCKFSQTNLRSGRIRIGIL
jgi:hypothetical protein